MAGVLRSMIALSVCTASLVAVVTAQTGQLAPAPPESLGLAPSVLAEATTLLQQYVERKVIAGAVAAVVRNGRVGYLEAVGVQDIASGAPMTTSSLFRTYSMTKAVTAVAAMMLHDEGRFRLGDPVSKYLPEFANVRVVDAPGAPPRPPARPTTVEDLLLHTSGLSHRTSELYRTLGVRSRADTLPVFIGKITRAPLMEDPHTRFRYSEATTVVGRLIEVWTGEPLDVWLTRRLFTPLGMRDTVFWVEGERRGRLATVYGPRPGGGLVAVEMEAVPFTERPALLEGAVGLISSAPDFLRFQQLLLDGGVAPGGTRLLSAATVARITANGLPPEVLKARGGRMGWGLANVDVVVAPRDPGDHVGEYGWDGTGGTIFWNDPARRTAVLLLTQSSPPNPDGLRQKFKAIIDRAVR